MNRLRLHTHATPRFDGQSSRASEVIINAGFSHLEFSRTSMKDVVACVGIDNGIDHEFVECSASSLKIALVLETEALSLRAIESVRKLHSGIDAVLTHNSDLLREFPDRARLLWLGGSYLRESEYLRGDLKSSHISISASRKNFLEGHKLRHEIIRLFGRQGLQVFGDGYRPYRSPKMPYSTFRYSVVVENARTENYFTEKLVHCLLFRCVPVYWGTAKLPDEFDERGFVRFDSLEELEKVWPTLSDKHYEGLRSYVLSNQRVALKYCSTEFTIQKILADVVGFPAVTTLRVEDYFEDFEKVVEGRAPFRPSPRARYQHPASYWLPSISRKWMHSLREVLRPFLDLVRGP